MLQDSELHELSSQWSRRWWVFLVTGFVWLAIAVIVLRFDISSVATIGLLLGAVFLFAAIYNSGWRRSKAGGGPWCG